LLTWQVPTGVQEPAKKKEGIDLTDQEALEHFEKLIVLVNAVYQPIRKSAFDGSCCPACMKIINLKDFKDSLSEKEFLISHLCQECQDKTFNYGK
jgi:hypothetical protein